MAFKWTDAQKAKLSKSMKAAYAAKRRKNNKTEVVALPPSFEMPVIEHIPAGKSVEDLAALIVAVWKRL